MITLLVQKKFSLININLLEITQLNFHSVEVHGISDNLVILGNLQRRIDM